MLLYMKQRLITWIIKILCYMRNGNSIFSYFIYLKDLVPYYTLVLIKIGYWQGTLCLQGYLLSVMYVAILRIQFVLFNMNRDRSHTVDACSCSFCLSLSIMTTSANLLRFFLVPCDRSWLEYRSSVMLFIVISCYISIFQLSNG